MTGFVQHYCMHQSTFWRRCNLRALFESQTKAVIFVEEAATFQINYFLKVSSQMWKMIISGEGS